MQKNPFPGEKGLNYLAAGRFYLVAGPTGL
jgi:hypothetical protein